MAEQTGSATSREASRRS
jgi:hypothetical protein